MKKVFVLSLCIIVSSVALAGSITVTAEDAGNGRLRIGYQLTEGSALPVGFGLDIMLSNGAVFETVVSASPYFPVYPGSIVIENGEVVDYGTPVAEPIYPDTLGGLGTSGATIEMGGGLGAEGMAEFVEGWLSAEGGPFGVPGDLDMDGDVDFQDYSIMVEGSFTAPVEAPLILLQLDGMGADVTTVTITENMVRGGIVGENAMPLQLLPSDPVTVVVPEPATALLLGLGGLVLRKKKEKR